MMKRIMSYFIKFDLDCCSSDNNKSTNIAICKGFYLEYVIPTFVFKSFSFFCFFLANVLRGLSPIENLATQSGLDWLLFKWSNPFQFREPKLTIACITKVKTKTNNKFIKIYKINWSRSSIFFSFIFEEMKIQFSFWDSNSFIRIYYFNKIVFISIFFLKAPFPLRRGQNLNSY